MRMPRSRAAMTSMSAADSSKSKMSIARPFSPAYGAQPTRQQRQILARVNAAAGSRAP
ncbi:hypothetical protein RB201_20295 [Streptomyces sp. S1A(2023)]